MNHVTKTYMTLNYMTDDGNWHTINSPVSDHAFKRDEHGDFHVESLSKIMRSDAHELMYQLVVRSETEPHHAEVISK